MNLKYLVLLSCICLVFTAVPGDLVNMTSLPGWPANITFSMYSGYLNVSSSAAIHYVLVTQVNTTNTNNSYPLLMWQNGGPGCSSMLGLFQEIGPYVQGDGEYEFNGDFNVWSWNQYANLLFLESPAGVGFSYNLNASRVYDDNSTAAEQYAALAQFFALYPELNSNKFWIAGESYAGVYIPTLAVWIDMQNNNKTNPLHINLQGIMVGNGVNSMSTLSDASIQFYYGHHLLSDYVYNMYTTACTNDPSSAGCAFALNMISTYTNNINPYDIYRYCYYGNYTKNTTSGYQYRYTPWFMQAKKLSMDSSNNSPCTWSLGLTNFFNINTVQTAFHVNASDLEWQECNGTIFETYNSTGSYWAYQYLLNATTKYTIFVYSGDTDSVVPFIDTENWISNLNLQITEEWRPWWVNATYNPGPQVAGYVQKYQGLTFATVKGVGHMVPQWKRAEALTMFQNVISGTDLPQDPFN